MTTPVNASELTELDSPTHFVVGRTSDGKYGKVTFSDPASVAVDADRAEAAAAAVKVQSIADETALAALDVSQWRAGVRQDFGTRYDWDASNLSAKISANDPRYVAPASAPTGASGAWKRAGSQVNTWAPVKWPSVDGSLYSGPIAHVWHRTGGYGTYGLALLQLSDDDELPTGELSSTLSAWASAKNQTGGTIFGAWLGANGPYLGQTGHSWTAGAIVGTEINAGNRYEELGLIGDLAGASRWTVGLQVVPDVLPADGMSPPVGIFHGSFGIAVHQSIHGHKWQTGFIVSADTIVAGGIGMKIRGGTVLGNAPSHGLYMDGYHTNGIVVAGNLTNALAVTGTATRGLDLSSATLTTAIRMAAGQGISWGSGGAQISTTGGSLSLSSGNADDDFAIYANNFGSRVFSADATGGVPRISFYNGVAPVAKQAVTGSWSGGTAGPNLAAALAALGLITNSTTA